MRVSFSGFLPAAALALLAGSAHAGPWVEVGSSEIRHDIQVLADAGVIKSPTATWPLSWGDINRQLKEMNDLEPHEMAALSRLQRAARRETKTGELELHTRVAAAENPRQIRSFEDSPREDAEVGLGLSWTGNWLTANFEGQWVDDPQDDKDWRGDGSYLGVALGNWMIGGSVQDRWWGPGWSNSLILSNNARPVPSLIIERNLTDPFDTKWLSWLGYWDLAMVWGFLGDDRDDVENARLFGLRLDFRPLDNFQIGFSRTAQWCGTDRPCDFDTFVDLLIGKDNRDSPGDTDDEPGNQLAGIDARISWDMFSQDMAFYTQWIGEDEADFFPSAWLAQFGLETWGTVGASSYRVYLEWTDTECEFRLFGSGQPDCAYNHFIYDVDGYRYQKRSIGSSLDNDASVFTLGGMLVDSEDRTWMLQLSGGNLNRRVDRRRAPDGDPRNTVAAVKTRYGEVEITHKQRLTFNDNYWGDISIAAGGDYRENTVTGDDDTDWRFSLDWQYTL